MKTILIAAAAALSFAMPAAAQPATSHQGHSPSEHAAHQSHAQHGAPSSAPHQGQNGHAQHGQQQGDGRQADCCGDANGNGRMDCCEGANGAQRPCCAGHSGHQQQGRPAAPAQPPAR